MKNRVYLDWNASAPLRRAARDAMVAALDVAGNPSAIHAEGRAARAVVERARAQVAAALGASAADVVFVSGATEAAALACADRGLVCAKIEHEAVLAWCDAVLPVDDLGAVGVSAPDMSAVQAANSETGVVQDLPDGLALVDATQAFGKVPFAFDWSGAAMAMVSAHKIGGPKGVGALVIRRGLDLAAQIRGGGQEMGRRSGTENVAAIAGFGAAAAGGGARSGCRRLARRGKAPRQFRGASGGTRGRAYLCRERRGAPAQHKLPCHARLEGRNAGHADGPGGICRQRRVGLRKRQVARQRRVGGDGAGRNGGGIGPARIDRTRDDRRRSGRFRRYMGSGTREIPGPRGLR